MRRRHSGFTLLELMFTIAVLGVLLGLAVPNFRDFLRNARLTSVSNDLLVDINVARTEAIKRRAVVTLCSSANSQEEVPANLTCRAIAATTFDGWFAFVDTDGDGVHDPGEDVLRQHGPLPDGVTSKSDMGFVSYADTGFARAIGVEVPATRVAFCDERGNQKVAADRSAARVVSILATGHAGVARDYDEVTTLLADVGGCP
jgi:type IV fimbrial biogenesis protein FimT